jgi:AraC-like DNA-binding protein
MLNMSARTLQRKLKDEFISFQNIVEEVKLEQAKDLIARGDNTLKEIAYLVGYSSVQSFTRGFKNREGVSPSKLISK